MMLFTVPVFLITVFAGGMRFDGMQALYSVIKYIVVLILIILVKNTNPRLRIDQAVNFFWLKMFPLAIVGFILALVGL
ncbi:NADH-quinone oxidoreductase subunit H [Candidatus Aerophobetes bacterium]|nr:NADH-quinone oxidoreductase subunit H [Candidatus Aerophobetes bacterium]